MNIGQSPDVRRRLALHSNPNSQHTQFGELQKEVSLLAAQNKRKYQDILLSHPDFPYQLYKIYENKSLSISFGRELLLKQMDHLLEEEIYLNR